MMVFLKLFSCLSVVVLRLVWLGLLGLLVIIVLSKVSVLGV